MTSIGSWLWGTSQLDDAVDRATSELLPSGAEDIALNLEICDQIRSKSVPAKDAMRALKRRLNHKNPNVQLLALGLTDVCIKNGGDQFLTEVASREFMDNLVSILKIPVLNIELKNTVLRLIQNWSVAFEGKPALSYVGQVYKTLVNEGYKFPPKDLAVANSAMVDSQTAPEWIDSDVCLRCRTPFTFTNRKHHCRNCGQVFDQQCSSKSMPLPHFGITQDVRVCDGCHAKLSKRNERPDKGRRHSSSSHTNRHRSGRDLADAELQRAIQLSLQEAEAGGGHARPGYVPAQPSPPPWQYSEPPIIDRSNYPVDNKYRNEEEDDPDLRAAIEASLREANAPKPSAPIAPEISRTEERALEPTYPQSYPPGVLPPQPSLPRLPNYDLEPLESDAILTFSQTVEHAQAHGGRDLSRYPAMNEMYDKANSLRPKLAMSLDDAGRKEEMLSDMHDKLSQAVKLYDQLLTEQVAHPRWRSPQPAASVSHQQVSPSYGIGYNTADGYNQWTPQAQARDPTNQPAYQVPSEPPQQPQSPQVAYSSGPPAQDYSTQYAGTPQVQTTQTQHQQQQYSEPPPPPPVQQQQQPLYAQHTVQYSTSPAPPSSQYIHAQTTPSTQPQPHQPYADQSHYQQQQYATQTPTQNQPPPVSYVPPQSLPSAPVEPSYQITPAPTSAAPAAAFSPSSPPVQYASPPAQSLVPKSHLPSSPSLARHNTVTSPSHAVSAHSQLARSNTAAHPTSHLRQQSQQQQPPQQYISSPLLPSTLPNFPVAPTTAPQSFPMYGSSIPSGIAQREERKEALLIDL